MFRLCQQCGFHGQARKHIRPHLPQCVQHGRFWRFLRVVRALPPAFGLPLVLQRENRLGWVAQQTRLARFHLPLVEHGLRFVRPVHPLQIKFAEHEAS